MVSRRHAGHRSFPRDNPREYCKRETDSENLVFSGFSLYSEFLSDTTKIHKIFTVTKKPESSRVKSLVRQHEVDDRIIFF